MRLLFIIGSMREGGAEGQLLLLMRELREQGHEVALMLLRAEGPRLKEAHSGGFPVIDVKLPLFQPAWNPLPWLMLPLVWLRAVAWTIRFAPNVVHAHLFWAHVWAWLLLIPLPRVKLVTSRLQLWTRESRPPLYQRIENRINRRACLVIANSKAVAKSCLGRERHLKGKIAVVPNGLDLVRLDGAEQADLRAEFPAFRSATSIAICVANLLPLKGHGDLLQAWKDVTAVHPKASLLCVGADCGELDRLKELAEALGIADRVVFAGSRRDVPSLVKAADLAVQASRDEGMSVALLEYMACGRPIVATDVGGTKEAIAHRTNGLLVPAGSAGTLAAAILELMADRELASRLARHAAADVRDRYSAARSAARHENLYRRSI